MHLFEAYGLLLGAGLAPVEQVAEQLQTLLALPLARLQALTAEAAAGQPPGLTTQLSTESLRQLTAARSAEASDAADTGRAAQEAQHLRKKTRLSILELFR